MKKSPFFPLLIPAEVWDVPPLLGRARVYIANLLQAFSSLFFWDLCSNVLPPYSQGTADLGGCDTSPIPGLLFYPTSIPASCPKSYSHFFLRPCIDCKHRVKSNRQRSECMSLPAVSGKCLLLYFITAAREICAFCSTTPSAMIPWGILLIIFQSDSQLTISFQNRNLPRRRKIVTCPLFSGNEKGILEDFYNSIKITRILRTDWQKWQPKKDWNVQCLFSWHNPS